MIRRRLAIVCSVLAFIALSIFLNDRKAVIRDDDKRISWQRFKEQVKQFNRVDSSSQWRPLHTDAVGSQHSMQWRAFDRWLDSSYLCSRVTQVTRVHRSRKRHFRYCSSSSSDSAHLQKCEHETLESMSMESLVRKLTGVNVGDDDDRYYYYYYSRGMSAGGDLSALMDDVSARDELVQLVPGTRSADAVLHFWSGNRTLTVGHFDTSHNIYVQVRGTKTFHVAPPSAWLDGDAPLHAATGLFDRQCIDDDVRTRRPSRWQAIELRAGDALFVPAGWFHFVEANTLSISVNVWRESHSTGGPFADVLAAPLPFVWSADWPQPMRAKAIAVWLHELFYVELRNDVPIERIMKRIVDDMSLSLPSSGSGSDRRQCEHITEREREQLADQLMPPHRTAMAQRFRAIEESLRPLLVSAYIQKCALFAVADDESLIHWFLRNCIATYIRASRHL
jgi:Cupin-like domain